MKYLRIKINDVLIPHECVSELVKIAKDKGYGYDGEKDSKALIQRMLQGMIADFITVKLGEKDE